MKNIKSIISVALVASMLIAKVTAAPINTSFDNFGALPQASFGGNGIPNTAVATTTWTDQAATVNPATIILGLSSHGRYENLLEGNDGAGTYFASAGSNTPPSSSIPGATWNFNYYIDIENGSFADFVFKLFYDFDPAVGNDQSTHGVVNFNQGFAQYLGGKTGHQDSQNLLFSFFSGFPILPGITPPSGSFDPNATGEYTFALVAYDNNNTELARSAIRVQVSSTAVPEPSVLALFGLGLLLACGRRFRKV